MSEIDREALFSDIDKIMEQQGFTNIGSSSTPIEVEATDEPEPENMATIRFNELNFAGIIVKTYIGDIFGKIKDWKPLTK